MAEMAILDRTGDTKLTAEGSRYQVESVEKACKVLTALAALGEAPLRDITEAVGEPKPTVYRLLYTLERAGFAEQTGPRGPNRRWKLGTGFQSFVLTWIGTTEREWANTMAQAVA